MTWCYRAVQTHSGVCVRHIYVNDGKVVSFSDSPYVAEAGTIEELQAALALVLSEILSHNVLNLDYLESHDQISESYVNGEPKGDRSI